MSRKKEIQSFAESMKRLEEISEILENETTDIEEAVKLYEEGILLSKSCYKLLREAELKITELKNGLESDLKDKKANIEKND